MNLDETFSLITNSFSNVFNKFSKLNISNELDWERHLEVELRALLADNIYCKYIIHLQEGAYKHDEKTLWITPNTYSKKQALLDNYFQTWEDEGGHYKIDYTNSLKPLNQVVEKFIEFEKTRAYYVDIIIYDTNLNQALAYIELKCKANLSEKTVLQDFYKLKRLESVRKFPAIYIAVGFDLVSHKIFWLPTDQHYNYVFKSSIIATEKNPLDNSDGFISKDKLTNILIESTKSLFLNTMNVKEAVWSAHLISAVQPCLPVGWRINSEIRPIPGSRGSIDLVIFDPDNNMHTAIEIKGHYEKPFPRELLNEFSGNNYLLKDFITQADTFLKACISDKSMVNKRSAHPRNADGYYVNSAFFEKIVGIYHQYNRMAELIESKRLVQGFMIFTDHNNDFSIRDNTYGISEESFIENFRFRKSLFDKVLREIRNKDCYFIYLYKLNSKNNRRNIFELTD